MDWKHLLDGVLDGDDRSLARAISMIENEVNGYEQLLKHLPPSASTIIGITGPPGAGKSTITDLLTGAFVNAGKRICVLCVDPSSPFNFGALLGDRIRMSQWYEHPRVFIRSLATRGSLGGLNPWIIEICDTARAAGFDHVIVETVGVGQSEVEIAGLADTTVVVQVPEGGDDIQAMKAGLMEVADIFVVNKCDRPAADLFIKNLQLMISPAYAKMRADIPIIKMIASQNEGIDKLYEAIVTHEQGRPASTRKNALLAERAYHLIQKKRMRDISKQRLLEAIALEGNDGHFNLYKFVEDHVNG